MIDASASGMAYNRLSNLDGIEDRIINYLLTYDNKNDEEKELVTRIRRILLYNDTKALMSMEEGGYPDPISKDEKDINYKHPDMPGYFEGLALVPNGIGTRFRDTPLVDTVIEEDEEGEEVAEPSENIYHWILADEAIYNLIYNDDGDISQSMKRVFRSPRLEDGIDTQCTMLKVYVDSIIPTDHLKAIVNVGIDVVVNTKIINVAVSSDDNDVYIYDTTMEINGSEVPYTVTVGTRSRVTTMVQAVIALLNGAAVQGVGKMIFSRNLNINNRSQYGIWNNRNFEGMKTVMGVYMSGVS